MQPNLQILDYEVDPGGAEPSFYRMLVNRKQVKYIEIDPKIYDVGDLCFPPILVTKLPILPPGSWTQGRISQAPNQQDPPYFSEVLDVDLPCITPLWHTEFHDCLSLTKEKRLESNVYLATCPRLPSSPVVVKYARFEWEIQHYIAETQAYHWLKG